MSEIPEPVKRWMESNPNCRAQSKTDPTTTLDRLLHALGAIQAAHGCLLGSTVANAGLIQDNLQDAAVTIKGIIKEMSE